MAIYTLDGTDKEISVLGRYASVKNNGSGAVYASSTPDLDDLEASDIVPIQPGESVVVRDCKKKLYVRGTGEIAVISGNQPFNFFKSAPVGGGGGGAGNGITTEQLNEALLPYATTASVDNKLSNKADKSDIPTSLPADGGNADTVEGMGLTDNGGGKGIIYMPSDGQPIEIGPYIDFNRNDGGDFCLRLDASQLDTLRIMPISGNRARITNADLDGNANTVGNYTPEQLIQSNPNLLDNPDFKINQRGKKEYTSSSAGQTYTADRWSLSGMNGLSANIGTDMVTLIGTSDTYPHWRQRTENPTMFAGKIVTLSCEWSSNGTDVLRIALADNDSGFSNWKYETFEGGGIVSMTVPIVNGIYCVSFIDMGLDGKGINLKWGKLEFGSLATPFVPPDPATELLKCQRYYEKGTVTACTPQSPNNTDWLTGAYFMVPKRIAPSMTITNFRNNTTPMHFEFTVYSSKETMTVRSLDDTRFEINNFLYNYEYEASADL